MPGRAERFCEAKLSKLVMVARFATRNCHRHKARNSHSHSRARAHTRGDAYTVRAHAYTYTYAVSHDSVLLLYTPSRIYWYGYRRRRRRRFARSERNASGPCASGKREYGNRVYVRTVRFRVKCRITRSILLFGKTEIYITPCHRYRRLRRAIYRNADNGTMLIDRGERIPATNNLSTREVREDR